MAVWKLGWGGGACSYRNPFPGMILGMLVGNSGVASLGCVTIRDVKVAMGEIP